MSGEVEKTRNNDGWFTARRAGNRFSNIITTYNGIAFDSIAEANVYIVLKKKEEQGRIKNLITQPVFKLTRVDKQTGENVEWCKYISDFQFEVVGQDRPIALDVKGKRTVRYLRKLRVARQQYPDIDFQELRAGYMSEY